LCLTDLCDSPQKFDTSTPKKLYGEEIPQTFVQRSPSCAQIRCAAIASTGVPTYLLSVYDDKSAMAHDCC